MKKELTDVKAFSVTNLNYIVWFYELYPDAINLPHDGVDSNDYTNLPQVGVKSDAPEFRIPWGHNKLSLPAEQSDLAQQITRDPYNFDFLTLKTDGEGLCETHHYDASAFHQ